MRRPRNRRRARKNRPPSKEHYFAMATRIQRCFRQFCGGRYRGKCVNYNDMDFISMNPVGDIPRDVLFVAGNTAFDARELFTWMLTTNVNPISREKFLVSQRQGCALQLKRFVSNSRKTQLGKKGFFSSHRSVLRSLGNHAKYPENN